MSQPAFLKSLPPFAQEAYRYVTNEKNEKTVATVSAVAMLVLAPVHAILGGAAGYFASTQGWNPDFKQSAPFIGPIGVALSLSGLHLLSMGPAAVLAARIAALFQLPPKSE